MSLSLNKGMNKRFGYSFKSLLTITFVFFFANITMAQDREISGVVKDDAGEGLPGVTVRVKGTTKGAITDLDGRFSLSASNDEVLVFSSVGFEIQEFVVGTKTSFDIAMKEDIALLPEVVVIGYGQVEKGDITGVVSKVDSDEFNGGQILSPETLIAGKVAGVQIVSNDGSPGGQTTIRIRGLSSLSASNEPLYVVDGIALDNTAHNPGGFSSGGRNPMSFINPADIADITVLKDASAAAIYGARASGGVIIITTKSGRKGKPEFSYSGSYSLGVLGERVTMLGTEDFRATVGSKGPKYIGTIGTSDTDWIDEVTQVAQGTSHNIASSFGGTNNSARVAFNYQELDGLILYSNTKRYTGSANYTHNLLGDDLVITATTKISVNKDRFSPNVMGGALVFAPTESVRADDPSTGNYFEWDQELGVDNPVSTLNQTYDIGTSVRYLFGGNIAYKIPVVSGLSAKMNYAYDRTRGKRQRIQDSTLVGSSNFGGSYNFEKAKLSSELIEYYLTYEKQLSGDSKIDLLAGYSYQNFFREYPGVRKTSTSTTPLDGIGDKLDYVSRSQRNTWLKQGLIEVPNNDELENRLLSYWGRVNYSFRDRYLLTATVRRDGSTRFAPTNRWGVFPSVAVGWRVLDESFAEPLKRTFSDLKFRLSYGVTGNQEIGDYLYLNLYDVGGDQAQYILGSDTVNVYRPASIDPNIKWEETNSLNFGIDYGILDGKVYGSLEFYNKTTSDLLSNITFPIGILPGDQAVTNIGEMKSNGIELLVNTTIIDRDDFALGITVNGSYNNNEITALDNSNLPSFRGYEQGGIAGDVGQTIQIHKVGLPAFTFSVYEHKYENGVPVPDGFDANGDGLKDLLDMYVDRNNDGIINENDLRPFHNPAPKFIFGFTSNLKYNRFDMAMTWRAQTGNYVYNNVASQYGAFEGVDGPFSPNNIHISAYGNNFTTKQLHSDIYVEDGSFLKLDNVTIGYNFKGNNNLQSRAYVTATNLLTISDYSGVDPEVGIGGIDNNIYPRSRMFIVGVNLTLN